jgi:predicted amidohydrolase YtcJ
MCRKSILMVAALSLSATACGRDGAEWVFRGGRVYTADAQRRVAEAVAVDGGRIVYVGDATGVASFVGTNTRVVDLKDRVLLPSFTDAHVHMLEGGATLDACNLSGLEAKDEILTSIAEYAAKNPEAEWIAGSGWSIGAFPDANPRKEDLDRIVPDRPVYLIAEDGHSGWANSRALELAEIDADTPDPERGRIERDAATGEPTGALRETAMDAVQELAFDIGPIDALRGLRRALAQAHAFGITSFVEARATISAYDWAYRALDAVGQLDARVVLSLWFDPARGDEQFEEFASRRSWDVTQHVRATAVKLFADGVAESRTAYLLEPYEGGDDRGEPNFTAERLAQIATRLDRDGFQLHFHAIGDAAVREALDAVAAARERNGARDARHQIAHLQLVDPADWPRFGALGVAANVQALWAYPAAYVMKLDVPALGAARTERMYPIASLVKANAPLIAGSDWPVSSMNPLEAIEVALTRREPGDPDGDPLGANEAVGLATMIDAYTIGGARLVGADSESGSIEVGKSADLVVFDRDLFVIEAEEIAQAKAVLTLFEGEVVYEGER